MTNVFRDNGYEHVKAVLPANMRLVNRQKLHTRRLRRKRRAQFNAMARATRIPPTDEAYARWLAVQRRLNPQSAVWIIWFDGVVMTR